MKKTLLYGLMFGLGGCFLSAAHAADEAGPGGIGDIIDPADSIGAAVDAIFPVIDFTDFLPPKVGFSYVDPIFGTVIKRVSDARVTTDNAGGGILPLISHEYSTVSPFNVDNSRMLLMHFSYFALYDGNGKFLRDMPFEVNSSSQPRWSRDDPDVFYYLNGNQLKQFDLGSNSRKVLREFREYEKISGMGESDLSVDGDHMVLVGDNRQIFVYNLRTNNKGPVLRMSSPGRVDHVFMTPRNNVLVGWYEQGTSRYNGLEMFDKNMNFIQQIAPVLGHMDVGVDVNGDEILLWTNAGHPSPPAGCHNAIIKIRLRDNRHTCLLPLDWGIGVHISAPYEGDSFIVSTYSSYDPSQPSPGPMLKYRDEILRVKLDGSEVERLAHHWSRSYDNYSFQPKASISRDGSRVVYGSNYRRQEKTDVPAIYTDAFLMCIECEDEVSRSSNWIINETYKIALLREEEEAEAVEYDGAWHSMFHSLLSGESVRVSGTAGDSVSYSFSGGLIGWVGYAGPLGGVAEVFVDGESRGIVDAYAPKHRMQQHLWSASDLGAGEHTLRIEVKANPPGRSGAWVWVDAFDTRPYTPRPEDLPVN